MSDSRNTLSNPTNLQEVTPRKTLFFTSMPCEKQAAFIRNATVYSMNQEDVGEVAYKYLQSRQGQRNTFHEIICWGSITAICLGLYRDKRYLANLFMMMSALHIPPNVGNTIRYRETKNSCEQWLSARLDKNKVEEIKAIKFSHSGIILLNDFLKREKINNDSVEKRLKNKPSV